jgi:hypothetical protein
MALHPEALKELERRGAGNIRRMMQTGEFIGTGPGAFVPIGLGDRNPRRNETEDWLAGKERGEERLGFDRHEQLLLWTKIAGVAAIIGAVAAIAAVIVPLLTGSH